MKNVKELKELLIALQIIGVFAKKVAADKKVNLEDLPYLVDLAKQMDQILMAVDGIDEIDDELKDIDEAEAMEVLGQLIKSIKAIKAA